MRSTCLLGPIWIIANWKESDWKCVANIFFKNGQRNRISIEWTRGMLPITTGASDSHKVMGIDWPSMNCEAAALKNGSRAETQVYQC